MPFRAVDGYKPKPEGVTKNIVICFDGTGGQPEWAVQAEREVPLYTNGGGLSNICKMHLFAGGVVDNSCYTFDDQISLYYKGVGTWAENSFLAMRNSAFGAGAMKEIYTMAYEDLKKIYQSGDKLYIFGFSRGAATARLFVSFISKEVNKIAGETPEVAFLGVFDTVVQSSQAGTSEDIKNVDIDGKDSSLPACVKRAVHLVSIDDRREPFRPTLFNEDPRVTEVWCPGNHSDIGGGYYHDGLSDYCLKVMMKEAETAGMNFREITKDTPKEAIVGECTVQNFAEFDKDMTIAPNALDPDVHDENTFMYWIMNWWNGFKHRTLKVMKDNAGVNDGSVLILDSTVERMTKWTDAKVPSNFQYKPHNGARYNPENLTGVTYKVVTLGEKGLIDSQGEPIFTAES